MISYLNHLSPHRAIFSDNKAVSLHQEHSSFSNNFFWWLGLCYHHCTYIWFFVASSLKSSVTFFSLGCPFAWLVSCRQLKIFFVISKILLDFQNSKTKMYFRTFWATLIFSHVTAFSIAWLWFSVSWLLSIAWFINSKVWLGLASTPPWPSK